MLTLHSTECGFHIWRAGRRSWGLALPGQSPTWWYPSLAEARRRHGGGRRGWRPSRTNRPGHVYYVPMRYLLLALLLAGCTNTDEVRRIAREEAEKAAKNSSAQQELDKLKADIAAKEAAEAKAKVFKDCCSNLRAIGSGMEMYSIDFHGRYPANSNPLAALSPSYWTVKTCGAGGRYVAETASSPDLYTVICTGGHPESAANYPQYTSVTGLIQRP